MFTRVTDLFKLPDVTAYLLAGVLIGPCVLGRLHVDGVGFISFEEVHSLSLLSDIALGFIAFSIGSEFKINDLKKIGRQAFTIGVFQALTATIVVDIVLVIVHFIIPQVVTLPIAIVLGAIASATAPAATIMVVRQYKAKGEITDILLPIVALDDAVGLIIFAVSYGIADAIIVGNVKIASIIIEPLCEIMLSLVLGCMYGVMLVLLIRLFKSKHNRLVLVITFLILSVALAKHSFNIFGIKIIFSPLLIFMMLGTFFCNLYNDADVMMKEANRYSSSIILLFFVLSGAELDFRVFSDWRVVMVGVIYIVTRSVGKYLGARYSAKVSDCSLNIQKYLGLTLLPQAGVALGMSAIVSEGLGNDGILIRNIVLFGVLIFELFGPTITKMALVKAGEITEINNE